MEIRFLFDPDAEQVTFDDLDTITLMKRGETGNLDTLRIHEFLSKFLVDENNNFVPVDQAFKVIGKLTRSQRNEAMQKFMEAVKIAAIPLPREVKSILPSERESEISPSPAG